MTPNWNESLWLDSSHEIKDLQKNNRESVDNSFEKVKERMKNVVDKIKTALGQTSILALKVWIIHPEMNSELQDLKKQIDQNKQNMSRESSCDILWKIKNLFDKYWDDRERAILNDWLTECLVRLPQLHTEIRDMKDSMDIIETFDKNIWDSIQQFAYLLPTKWSKNGGNDNTPTKPNRWCSIRPSDMT